MLKSIQIKDFILIESLDLDLADGFCVLTGETGAGKSILLDAILFCLGQKIARNPVRASADSCSVTLAIDGLEHLKTDADFTDLDIDFDNELILKATQNAQGRKKFFLNDQLVSVKIANLLFDHSIEMHGQHSHTRLLSPIAHMDIIDRFCSENELIAQLHAAYRNWKDLVSDLDAFGHKEAEILQEIDYLKHSYQELDEANIMPDEELVLVEQKTKLQAAQKASSALEEAINDMETSNFGKLVLKIQKSITQYPHEDIETINKDLDNAYTHFDCAYSALQKINADQVRFDYSLEDVDERLHQIRSLARKYGVSSSNLNELLNAHQQRLEELERTVLDSNDLANRLEQAKQQYFKLAHDLSYKRSATAKLLQDKVTSELGYLDMKKAMFQVDINSDDNFAGINGIDKIRFLVATNPGMAPAPIDKVASGGELSRVMLALRVALLDKNPKQTIICDEIDIGISGSVADSMGLRIKELSKVVQVLVITHQPQVAGKADLHMFVSKNQLDKSTFSTLKVLTEEERVQELARMISGQAITEAGLKAARELLHHKLS
jgi:DNA repair protein RecN (Recombination protein N)